MRERKLCVFRILLALSCLILLEPGSAESSITPAPSSLCSSGEQVIFSCSLRKPRKLVSLCGSRDLTKTKGYLQYRFGVPGKIELEFPKDKESTQKQFRYEHYFRSQVDNTSISFSSGGFNYRIFDEYNGEEKPRQSDQGVRVTTPTGGHEVTLVCREKAKADYFQLQEVLPNEVQ